MLAGLRLVGAVAPFVPIDPVPVPGAALGVARQMRDYEDSENLGDRVIAELGSRDAACGRVLPSFLRVL